MVTCSDKEDEMGEWKIAFDRIMDQLYNHPEEMRARLLAKYEKTAANTNRHPQTAIELLQSLR